MELTVEHKEDRRTAAIVAIVVHAIIGVLFLFYGLTQPNPLPEEFDIPIAFADYGTSDVGSGSVETENPSDQNSEQEAAAASASVAAPNEVTTQDAPSDVSAPDVTSNETKPDPTPTKPKEPAKPTVSTGLSGALDAWNTNGGGSGGDGDDDKPGNQGLNTGEKDGSGSLQGAGFSVSGFGGRGLARNPKVTGDPQENGKVVLDVCVDREGNITKAEYNMMQSTTNSSRLINMAKKAAKGAKFNSNPNATFEQCGRMVFNFQLK